MLLAASASVNASSDAVSAQREPSHDAVGAVAVSDTAILLQQQHALQHFGALRAWKGQVTLRQYFEAFS